MFTPNSKAESIIKGHPSLALTTPEGAHSMADNIPASHSQRQIGTLFLSLGPKLQGKPHYVALICTGAAVWRKVKSTYRYSLWAECTAAALL